MRSKLEYNSKVKGNESMCNKVDSSEPEVNIWGLGVALRVTGVTLRVTELALTEEGSSSKLIWNAHLSVSG